MPRVDAGRDSDYIHSYTLDAGSNAMRAVVEATFKQECQWSLRYWKTDEGEDTAVRTAVKTALKGPSYATMLFLAPQTDYSYVIEVNGKQETGVETFRTIKRPSILMDYPVVEKTEGDWVDGYILQTNATVDGFVTLCDYDGRIVWYEYFGMASDFAWYNPKNGLLSVYCGSTQRGDESKYMICADLSGKVLFRKRSDNSSIPNIHHDFRMLDNGNMLALSKTPKDYDGQTYWGEAMTEIDQKGNIVFRWDTHKYFNPYLFPDIENKPGAKDYLHANSVEKDSNGDYYMTLNWLTEIIKIDGKTGELLYRFGERGDVTLTGETPAVYSSILSPSEFFKEGSAVHSAIALEPDRILCLANGKNDDISKAVIVKIDPVKKEAHYEMIVDFEKRFRVPDRSNVSLLPGNRLLLGAAPWNAIVVSDYSGKTLRVITRSFISPRSIYYDADAFNYYLNIRK